MGNDKVIMPARRKETAASEVFISVFLPNIESQLTIIGNAVTFKAEALHSLSIAVMQRMRQLR